MYSANRSHRAETRNRTKDELRKVISSIEKVRKWEKKWVLIKDTSIKIQKWVPGIMNIRCAFSNVLTIYALSYSTTGT
uniref:B-cell CLL/lymphoma 7 protein family member A n=1 Tax=Heterorhabditis bacteriophora TaxID=37862 RepID=A0A1I7W9Q1_HETBA